MKDRIKDYFTFTRKEQQGMIVLLGIMILSICAAIFLPRMWPDKQFDIGPYQLEVEQFLASAQKADSALNAKPNKIQEYQVKVAGPVLLTFLSSPFQFDPNKISEEEWMSMGMDPKITRNILRYREKGGKFRDSEGFRKIYGMTDEVFAILEPYLQFDKTGNNAWPEKMKGHYSKDTSWHEKAGKKLAAEKALIDLNSADSASLLALTGIGPSFAGRIIRYRDRLGGFYNKEQMLEVNGMDSLRYNQFSSEIYCDTGLVRKIDLNKVKFKEMMRHPYFEYYLVKAIFNKKDELKSFDSVGQIRFLPVMYEELFDKISPYLEVK
jgi:DNA uptake protein ComE-like DNA-binding protein